MSAMKFSSALVLAMIASIGINVLGQSAPNQTAAPQTPARDAAVQRAGSGRIAGRVVSADTGAPLRRARVTLVMPRPANAATGTSIDNPVVATDDQGRFAFNGLAPGRYTLSASKAGYMTLGFGQRRVGERARPVDLVSGQLLENADFNLPRGAVLAVRAIDDHGEPVDQLFVQLQQPRYVNGERQLVTVRGYSPFSGTSDLGEDRLDGLEPGEYYVMVTTRPGSGTVAAEKDRVYGPTYFPGTLDPIEARPVTLTIGNELSLVMPMVAVRPATITGSVRRSDGRPASNFTVQLATGTGWRGSPARPDGSFIFPNVMPGDYAIGVGPTVSATAEQREFARIPVQVTGADITGLVVTTTKGSSVAGKLVFEDGAPEGIQPSALALMLRSTVVVGGSGSTNGSDWTFRMNGALSVGVVRVSNPTIQRSSGWYLKAVMMNGRDIVDTPVDFGGDREFTDVQVVMTRRRASLGGTAVDGKAVATSDYTAVLFPEDRAQWTPFSRFIAAASSDQQGRFIFQGMPPARYRLAAVEFLEPGSELDPAVLAGLYERATPVTLVEGENIPVTLTRLESRR